MVFWRNRHCRTKLDRQTRPLENGADARRFESPQMSPIAAPPTPSPQKMNHAPSIATLAKRRLLSIALTALAPVTLVANDLFYDDFESGDMTFWSDVQ